MLSGHSLQNFTPRCICKVCSINFEPPDIDLCSACHVYPLFREAWVISILFIYQTKEVASKFLWPMEPPVWTNLFLTCIEITCHPLFQTLLFFWHYDALYCLYGSFLLQSRFTLTTKSCVGYELPCTVCPPGSTETLRDIKPRCCTSDKTKKY